MKLKGKLVVITGAKGGLGTSVTNAALEAGATVVGVSRSIRQSDFAHPKFVAAAAELSSLDAARTLLDSIVQQHGRIDAVMHLVGGFDMGPAVDSASDAAFEKMLDVNFRSALHLFRAVIPHMQRQLGGAILAIGSRAAVEPAAGTGPYNVSKAALVSLVRTIAEENKAHGISANVILPSIIDTAVNRAAMPNADFSKWVQPAQIAAMLVHLASESASQVTGAVIPIYGGS